MICVHDVSSIYRVPLLLEEQGVVNYFCRRLDLPIEGRPRKMLAKWKEMSDRCARYAIVSVGDSHEHDCVVVFSLGFLFWF